MALYFIDVYDGNDWQLDPAGVELATDKDVEQAALAGLRDLVNEHFMRCAPCSLAIRVSGEDTNEVFNAKAEIHPRWWIARR